MAVCTGSGDTVDDRVFRTAGDMYCLICYMMSVGIVNRVVSCDMCVLYLGRCFNSSVGSVVSFGRKQHWRKMGSQLLRRFNRYLELVSMSKYQFKGFLISGSVRANWANL